MNDPLKLKVQDMTGAEVDELVEIYFTRMKHDASQHVCNLLKSGAVDTGTLTSADVRVLFLAAVEERLGKETAKLSPAQKATLSNLRKF